MWDNFYLLSKTKNQHDGLISQTIKTNLFSLFFCEIHSNSKLWTWLWSFKFYLKCQTLKSLTWILIIIFEGFKFNWIYNPAFCGVFDWFRLALGVQHPSAGQNMYTTSLIPRCKLFRSPLCIILISIIFHRCCLFCLESTTR